MAAERSKRSNAGNRMNQMLEADNNEDEFYKTTYGGFAEEVEDNDYNSEDSDSESTDSDFSIDENDEAKSDNDDDDEPKRRKRVVTKAYKEPKREPVEKKPKVEQEKKEKKKKSDDIPAVQIYKSPERKSLRKSTALKSKQVQSRIKIREEQAKILADIADKKNMKVEDMRRLTQEELLAEAKITEQLNLKSLETYERLELEKKRTRVQKQVYRGPVIRFHSVTMPVMTQDTSVLDPEINVDGDGDVQTEAADTPTTDQSKPSPPQATLTSENCSRTFITFTDDATFNELFPPHRRKVPQRHVCPITRLPAKYMDPITQTPYATLQAFRLIREAYAKQLAQENNGKKAGEAGSRDSTPPPTSQTPGVAQQKRRDKAQAGAE